MSSKIKSKPPVDHSELLGAALRYCTVADWFEAYPCRWHKRMSEEQALEIFNRVETELRAAGVKALRQHGHRDLILQGVGVPEKAR